MHPQGPQHNQPPQQFSGDLFPAMPPQGPQFGGQPEFGTPTYGYRGPEDVARNAHLYDANPQQPHALVKGEQFFAALTEETPTEVMNIGPNAETMRIPRETINGIIGGIASREAASPQTNVTYTRQELRKLKEGDQRAQQPQDTSASQWGPRQKDRRPKAQEPRPDEDWTMEDYDPFGRR